MIYRSYHQTINGLRAYHQTLKTIVTWLVSMESIAAIKSAESVMKANYNLAVFERWLGRKLDEINNPIVVIIKSEEKKKLKKERKAQTNLTYQMISVIFRLFTNLLWTNLNKKCKIVYVIRICMK